MSVKLAIGPLSPEIIEAAFRCTHPIMLIASKNQIDHSRGYVNNWTTDDYCDYLRNMRAAYPNHQVKVCRDHCGPGFNGNYDLQDSYETIANDINNGFDLIHIDLCHHDEASRLHHSQQLIEYALSLNPKIGIEIGTDENTGDPTCHPDELEKEVQFFTSFCKPEYYVVQTGSLVMEVGQTGTFDAASVKQSSDIIHAYGLKLKEHNADYLNEEQIQMRVGMVDAMNIAPQLGVIQTMCVLTQAMALGCDPTPFLKKAYASGKWKKWFKREASELICSISCGHYIFTSEEYKTLYSQIGQRIDLRETIIQQIAAVIKHYIEPLNENSQ